MDDPTAIGASSVLAFLTNGRPDMSRIPAPADAQRQAEEAAKTLLIGKVVPPGVASVVLGKLERLPVQEYVDSWHKSPARGLVIRGGVGAGKSVAAGYAASLAIRAGQRSVSWHRPNDFVSAVLHSYDDNAPKIGQDLVVIDDCGRETKADFCEALCAFIDDRATRFVLTTNMQREQFRAHYDARLIDRLNHCAKAFTVKGDSRRNRGDF